MPDHYNYLIYIICAVVTYLFGSINYAILLSKFTTDVDVRLQGSGNAGSTNVFRCVGRRAGAAVMICDLLKGASAAFFAKMLADLCDVGRDELMSIACICVITGHIYPVFFGFRGGKGVMALAGCALVFYPLEFIAMLMLFAVIFYASRIVSLSSICTAIALPVFVALGGGKLFPSVLSAIICSLIVIFSHRSNIVRLIKGQESKMKFR